MLGLVKVVYSANIYAVYVLICSTITSYEFIFLEWAAQWLSALSTFVGPVVQIFRPGLINFVVAKGHDSSPLAIRISSM